MNIQNVKYLIWDPAVLTSSVLEGCQQVILLNKKPKHGINACINVASEFMMSWEDMWRNFCSSLVLGKVIKIGYLLISVYGCYTKYSNAEYTWQQKRIGS